MHDVLRHVVLAVRDEDLLAADAVVIPFPHRLGAQQREVGAGLRLGQVHRARPGARHHLVEEGLLQLVAAAEQQRLDRALREQRAERERHVGRGHHLGHRRGDKLGQALPAPLGIQRQAVPAAFDELLVGFLETLGRLHRAVLPLRAFLVARPVQWVEHLCGELGRFLQDGVDGVRRGVLASREFGYLGHPGELIQDELHVFEWGGVGAHLCTPEKNDRGGLRRGGAPLLVSSTCSVPRSPAARPGKGRSRWRSRPPRRSALLRPC